MFFIKASGYKMVEDNSYHGADSYWYSIEHAARKSVFHMLFPTNKPPDTIPGNDVRVRFQYPEKQIGIIKLTH